MAGKYAKVLKDLPKLPSEMRFHDEPKDYQQRVDLAKDEIRKDVSMTPTALADHWGRQREEESRLEQLLSDLHVKMRATEQLMEAAYEGEGLTSLTLAKATVRYQPEPYSVVTDPETYRLWCLRQKLGPLMRLPWQTTNSQTKERLLAGQPLPPGVKAFNRPKFVLTRS